MRSICNEKGLLQNLDFQSEKRAKWFGILVFPDAVPPVSVAGIGSVGKGSAGLAGTKILPQKLVAAALPAGIQSGILQKGRPEAFVIQVDCGVIFLAEPRRRGQIAVKEIAKGKPAYEIVKLCQNRF